MKQQNIPTDPKEIVDLSIDNNDDSSVRNKDKDEMMVKHKEKVEMIVKVEPNIKVEGVHSSEVKSPTIIYWKDPPVLDVKGFHDNDMDGESFHKGDDANEEDEEEDKYDGEEDDKQDDEDDDDNDGYDQEDEEEDKERSPTAKRDPNLILFDEYLTFCKVVRKNRDVSYILHHNEFFRCDVCTKNLWKEISHDAHANWCRQSSFFKNKMKKSGTVLEERGVPQRLVDYFLVPCRNAEPVMPAPREVLGSDPSTPSTSNLLYCPKKN